MAYMKRLKENKIILEGLSGLILILVIILGGIGVSQIVEAETPGQVNFDVKIKGGGVSGQEIASKIKLYKKADKQSVRDSEDIIYSIVLKNNNNRSVYGLTISDEIPKGIIYIPGTAAPEAIQIGNRLSWKINEMAPNSTFQVKFKARADISMLGQDNKEESISIYSMIKTAILNWLDKLFK